MGAARTPRWSQEEIAKIDKAKAAVERDFGIEVGGLGTISVKGSEVRLRTREGLMFRHREVSRGKWITEALVASNWTTSAKLVERVKKYRQ